MVRLIFFFFSIAVHTSILAQNVDITLLKKINLNRYKVFDKSFNFLTNTSDFTAIASPIVLLTTGFINGDEKLKKEGFNAACATIGSYSVGYILKKAIDRNRPYETYPFIQNYKIETGESFPSGSTALAFSTATSLSLSFPKWYVIVPSAIYATGVGYSRLHLGAHYPSDVIAGAVLGAGSAFLSAKLNKMILNQHRKRKIEKNSF